MTELKEAVSKAFRLLHTSQQAAADGKITVLEGIKIGSQVIPLIKEVGDDWQQILKECREIDTLPEIAELVAYVGQEFSLPNSPETERKVRLSVSMVSHALGIIELIKQF
jgi:hypothetical protein